MAREKNMTETIIPATQNTSSSPSKTEKHMKCSQMKRMNEWSLKSQQRGGKIAQNIYCVPWKHIRLFTFFCLLFFSMFKPLICVFLLWFYIVTVGAAATAVCHFVTCHFYIWKKLCIFLSIYLHILNVREREKTHTRST